MTEQVVITRHPGLVEYLVELGIIAEGTPVLSHATAKDVEGKAVIGVLPLSLAALAESVLEVPMSIPAELRGVELNLEQTRAYAGKPVLYVVKKV